MCTFPLYLLASVSMSAAPIVCSYLHKVSHDRFYPTLLDPPGSHLVPEKALVAVDIHQPCIPRDLCLKGGDLDCPPSNSE